MKRRLCIFLAVMFIFAFTYPVMAEEQPSVGIKVVDLLLVRPMSLAVSSVSTGIYIGISPLVFVLGVGEPAARVMVEAPWRFTAGRYLGDFNHYKDNQPITVVSE
jgi:hypothetical protein